MQKRYWKNSYIIRDKKEYWIDYEKQLNNNCEIYSNLNWKKIYNFLVVCESKGLINNDNIELIYTSLIFLSNTTTGIVISKHFNKLSDTQEIYFRYDK